MSDTPQPSAEAQKIWDSWNEMTALGNNHDEMDMASWAVENFDRLFSCVSQLEQQVTEKDKSIRGYVETERQLIRDYSEIRKDNDSLNQLVGLMADAIEDIPCDPNDLFGRKVWKIIQKIADARPTDN